MITIGEHHPGPGECLWKCLLCPADAPFLVRVELGNTTHMRALCKPLSREARHQDHRGAYRMTNDGPKKIDLDTLKFAVLRKGDNAVLAMCRSQREAFATAKALSSLMAIDCTIWSVKC